MNFDLSSNLPPRAILFDMDGTLTAPLLDFAAIKAEIGIGPGPILESLEALDPVSRAAALEVLHRHEDAAATFSTLNDGCIPLLKMIAEARIATAVITRNRRSCAQTIFDKHQLAFNVLVTREDCVFKPDPAPLRRACRMLGIAPDQAWMVGDGQYDIEAANRAGTPGIWISHGRERWFDAVPWRTVNGLPDLLELLKQAKVST